jgi:hypothetical protein
VGRTKLTDEQVAAIIRRRDDGESGAALASEFGVTPGYVWNLANGYAHRGRRVREEVV